METLGLAFGLLVYECARPLWMVPRLLAHCVQKQQHSRACAASTLQTQLLAGRAGRGCLAVTSTALR